MKSSSESIRKVHLIFKTHLDVGYTDFAQSVVQLYYTHFIPQALDLAEKLRQAKGPERFVWTTGSWLIYTYLEQASPLERRRMEEAILAGDIAWHGLPFTSYSEMMDASLYRHGLSLAQRLDERFGRQTIAAKMTDVPGHTRAIVPLLASAGIRFLHIGVNAASCAPDVPPLCVWRDPSGAEIVLMYHKSSYGEGMAVPGLEEAIQFAFTNDNEGPQSPEAVRAIYRQVRDAYPNAEVQASTLDAFARAVLPIKDRLPVVTAEIGDTWIHGVGTDPRKAAQFRALQRLRQRWLSSGLAKAGDPHLFRFSQNLLLVAEHTWGLDIKVHLADFDAYATEAFQARLGQANYRKVETSWAEQRAYLEQAVQALGNTPMAVEARAALRDLEPRAPDQRGFMRIYDTTEPVDTAQFTVRFNERGAITGLQDRTSGLRWASPGHELAAFTYQTFSQADYDRYYRQYNRNKRQTRLWALPDFTKPGMASAQSESREWLPTLQALWHRHEARGDTLLAELACPAEATRRYGCPRRLTNEFFFPRNEATISLTFQWFQKGACRLPEALWLSFCPRLAQPAVWKLEKMGQFISPLEVMRHGNRRLHAIDRGAFYDDGFSSLALESLDAPLVAPGERSLLSFTQRQPDLRQGLHFNLYNNIWGTNHPMWYDEDARFRFQLRLPESGIFIG
jgi:hypothetical protein